MDNVKLPFAIKPTDQVFYDSPDSGDPKCLCSRCGIPIREGERVIRAWPTHPDDFGYDPAAKGGTEFRFHAGCL